MNEALKERIQDAFEGDFEDDEEGDMPELTSMEEMAEFLVNMVGIDDGENCLKMLSISNDFPELDDYIPKKKQVELWIQEQDGDALRDHTLEDLNPRLVDTYHRYFILS